MLKRQSLVRTVAEWLEETELPPLTSREVLLPTPVKNLSNILAVVGPRRAGKTYFLYQQIQGLLDAGVARDEILFVDFEDYRLRSFEADDMDALLTAFVQLTGKQPRHLFFDEVQHLPEWSRILRTLHNRRRYTLVVTGSNSSLLHGEVAAALRGRYEDVLLLPFSFREYLVFRKLDWDRAMLHTPARGTVIREFEQYMKYGGFPEVALRQAVPEKRKLLQNYYSTIFYKDILDRHGIKARALLERVMVAVLNGSAELFSLSSFSRQLKGAGLPGSKRTLANYLQYLQEAFFVISTEKYSPSARVRSMNPRKVYVLDPGFGLLSEEFSENRGGRLETAVAIELSRRGQAIFYFKDRGECDFIVKRGTRPALAWQVCWEVTRRNQKREFSGLLEAMQKLDLKQGGVLTFNQDEEVEWQGRRIRLLPAWKWMLGSD